MRAWLTEGGGGTAWDFGFLAVLFTAGGLLLGFITGCDDPSNIGLSVVDDGQGTPQRLRFNPKEVGSVSSTRFPSGTSFTSFLAGQVQDPLFGEVALRGYVDIDKPALRADDLPSADDITAEDIEKVLLQLPQRYVYGATNGTVEYEIREVTRAWDADGTHADTTISHVGPTVTTVTTGADHQSISIDLTDHWTQSQDLLSLLASHPDTFNAQFHGYELRARSGNRVHGYGMLEAEFLVINAEDDTLDFNIEKFLTTTTRRSAPQLTDSQVATQNLTGPAVKIALPVDSLSGRVISDTRIAVNADTLAMQNSLPSNFTRPVADTLSLFGVRNGSRQILDTSPLTDGEYVFSGQGFTEVLQQILLGQRIYDHYIIAPFPGSNLNINSVALYNDRAEDGLQPRVSVTVVGGTD